MKILLQHQRTLHYVRTVETWTTDSSDAHNFRHSERAINFAHEHGLNDVYVTVRFPGEDPDVSIPLPAHALNPQSQARLY
jgi:hypothetical protein